jgi:hypothetical protein
VLLPNPERALINPVKLYGYLLSTTHPIGRFKARFFGALGFSVDQWEDLEVALREQHLTQNAEFRGMGRFGQLFTIEAILKGPAGSAFVVSVWLVRDHEDYPRFVTAYPGVSQ